MHHNTYDALASLPFVLEECSFGFDEQTILENYTRVTTTLKLSGKGFEGLGEDVTYDEPDQRSFHENPVFPEPGEYTLESFSRHLESLNLFPKEPAQEAYYHYRQWAYESAALDLALQQNQVDLSQVLENEIQPLTFVMSKHLPDPPDLNILREILDLHPGLRFKLDPTSSWNDTFCRELAALESVDCLDLKGQYEGTPVDQPADPALYERVVRCFPDAWIEDPKINSETTSILQDVQERITWDAIIHSVEDIRSLSFPPKALNMKPSRFGSLRELLKGYDYCKTNGILMYGGGQSELSVGRDQIQILASLFHSDTSNDVAPRAFNRVPLEKDLPKSPLHLKVAKHRFRLES